MLKYQLLSVIVAITASASFALESNAGEPHHLIRDARRKLGMEIIFGTDSALTALQLLLLEDFSFNDKTYKTSTISTEAGEPINWKPKHASDSNSVASIVKYQSGKRDDGTSCPSGFMGHKCDERICPYSLAWSASAYQTDRLYRAGVVGQHAYEECGGVGTCDRTTGVCKCAAGYEGKGCKRAVCPNKCSGHGQCLSNYEISLKKYVSTTSNDFSGKLTQAMQVQNHDFSSQFFDSYKQYQCKCDRGFEGYDCSRKMCPRGDDVLTACDSSSSSHIQKLLIATPSTADPKARSYIALTFTDLYNGVYTTRSINVNKDPISIANAIEDALLDLPNGAIPSIQVSGKLLAPSGGNRNVEISITFIDSANSGKQNLLECGALKVEQMCDGGMVPMYKNDYAFTCTVSDVNGDSNLKENLVCGNRGICNSATGTCKCFQGHTGERCDEKTVFF